MNTITRSLVAAVLAATLPGCATVSTDAGFASVRQKVIERLDVTTVDWHRNTDATVAGEVRQLLQAPLTPDAAVQVALLNNRTLQAEYEELGVAQADLVQAGLLKNPVFGWSRQEGGDITKTNWGVELDFLGLLLAAPRKKLEGLRFEHTKLRVARAVVRHAQETRKAWVEAVAAQQAAEFLSQAAELTHAEAELGQRQLQAGNLSRRDALRQQAFDAETLAALANARQTAHAARERLNRQMGVWREDANWTLPARLPDISVALPVLQDVEGFGLKQRLDIQMAQKEAETFAAALGITRDTRFINVFDIGVETEKGTGERRITGPNLKFELPIFDQGQARVSRQEALYRQSEARLYALAVDARSEIRESWQRTVTSHATALHARDRLLPLRRKIVEESTLHYNGMLIGVYELLADAREELTAVQNHINATRDFWLALADLQMALGGRLPVDEKTGRLPQSVEVPNTTEKATESAHQHEEHQQ